ncbi:DUF1254 domain-containing protein [Cupriavidus necator]
MKQDLDTAISDAFAYGFPLYEVARTRYRDMTGWMEQPRLAPNTICHDRRLADNQCRWITTPNNDTLYSRAWLDLSGGPVQVAVDALPPDRYWSIAFMDAFTNNFALLGQHLDAPGPVVVTLAGPDDHAKPIAGRVIRAPGNDVWLLARWIVNGEDDLAAAHAMQECLSVTPCKPVRSPVVEPTDSMDPANFLAVVAEQLERNPPPAEDASMLSRIAAVGMVSGACDPWTSLPDATRRAWQSGIAAAHSRIRSAFISRRRKVRGWWVLDDLEDADARYEWRAALALGGLGALPPAEATYIGRTTDDDGQLLHGSNNYCLTIPRQGIPAEAFWSLSLYEPTPDGRRFFVENPINRYSIGDRTAQLHHEPDNSLRIYIQHRMPEEPTRRANWLPAPTGLFQLSLRAYRPRREIQAFEVPLPILSFE